jgi:hypothetical protein
MYTSLAAPYVASPGWVATKEQVPVVVKLVTLKFGTDPLTATVQIVGVSEVTVTARPVAELSDCLSDVAVKFCVVLVVILAVVETLII